MNFLLKHWPLWVANFILCLTIAIVLNVSLITNNGHLIYAFDDAYIHMAIAKNFALYHVWGVTRYAFTSSGSSLFWPILVSVFYFLFGVHDILPFILNVSFSLALIVTVYFILARYVPSRFYIFIALSLLIVAAPLPLLIFSGMEHILHALLTVLFIFFFARYMSESDFKIVRKHKLLLYAIAPLLTSTRFEGCFLVFIVCILLLYYKRISDFFAVAALGAFPVLLYAIISMYKGWHYLPNSVWLKGNYPSFESVGEILKTLGISSMIAIIQYVPAFFLFFLSIVILFYLVDKKQRHFTNEMKLMNIVFILAAILHYQYVQASYFYRHDAYILVLGLVVVAVSGYQLLSNVLFKEFDFPALSVQLLLIIALIFPFMYRGKAAFVMTAKATRNIFEQQYQMGLFLKKYYNGQAVALNDIGAACYLPEIKLLDLWGLGTLETAYLIKTHNVKNEILYKLADENKVKIAIIYDKNFNIRSDNHRKWTNVGTWRIAENVICGGDTVTFYAVDPAETTKLKENLRDFSTYLPRGVTQTGYR